MLFKKAQELQTETMKEKAVLSEIEGTRSSLKHLNHQLQKLDFETLKQQEIMYSQVDIILWISSILIYYSCDGQDTPCSNKTKNSKYSCGGQTDAEGETSC